MKRITKRVSAPPIPPLKAREIKADVELTPPTQDAANVQAQVTNENQVDIQRYLRWADKAIERSKPRDAANSAEHEADMNEANLKIAKYEPLTFQCIRCDQKFDASGKSLNQVTDEVADHIAESHPEVSDSDLQNDKAA